MFYTLATSRLFIYCVSVAQWGWWEWCCTRPLPLLFAALENVKIKERTSWWGSAAEHGWRCYTDRYRQQIRSGVSLYWSSCKCGGGKFTGGVWLPSVWDGGEAEECLDSVQMVYKQWESQLCHHRGCNPPARHRLLLPQSGTDRKHLEKVLVTGRQYGWNPTNVDVIWLQHIRAGCSVVQLSTGYLLSFTIKLSRVDTSWGPEFVIIWLSSIFT